MRRRTFLNATLGAFSLIISAAPSGLSIALAPFSTSKTRQRSITLPPLPQWNKKTDDIDNKDYLRRLQDYERSLLPPDITFPRIGQVWEAIRDCKVTWMAWGCKLVLPGGRTRLQEGERVRISALDDPKPLRVTFQPIRYRELVGSIVPDSIRAMPGYQHYTLNLKTAYTICCIHKEPGYFRDLFRLVEELA